METMSKERDAEIRSLDEDSECTDLAEALTDAIREIDALRVQLRNVDQRTGRLMTGKPTFHWVGRQ